MGARYYESLADRTTLMLQLQGFAACGDTEVRDLVRDRVARMWDTVADTTGLDPVTVKSFLAFGMLLSNMAALDAGELDEPHQPPGPVHELKRPMRRNDGVLPHTARCP